MQGDGGFNQNDENFTNLFFNIEERNQALKDEISRRIDTLGASGIIRLIMDKSTKCFGDGTYELAAFFYHGMAKDAVLNDYVVGNGLHYSQYKTFCTGIFFFLLMWETSARYITKLYSDDIYMCAVIGMKKIEKNWKRHKAVSEKTV